MITVGFPRFFYHHSSLPAFSPVLVALEQAVLIMDRFIDGEGSLGARLWTATFLGASRGAQHGRDGHGRNGLRTKRT